MSWKKTDLVLKKRFNQHGMGEIMDAGQVCLKAEGLFPGLFRAVSVKNNCLHIELRKRDHLAFKMIEGRLIKELGLFTEKHKLATITRVRLTFSLE